MKPIICSRLHLPASQFRPRLRTPSCSKQPLFFQLMVKDTPKLKPIKHLMYPVWRARTQSEQGRSADKFM